MGEIFSYSIASGILLAAMYLIYKWMLAGENQHRYNRAVLWSIYGASAILPLIIPAIKAMSDRPTKMLDAVTEIAIGTPQMALIETTPPLLPRVLLGIYIIGMASASVYTMLVAIRLIRIVTSGEKHRIGQHTLVLTDTPGVAPFSWLRYIVMSRADHEASGDVITVHETRHLDARHWIDLLMAQIIAIFQWYNPAAWLMREELKAIHEYQADEAVMQSGSDLRQYQMLLIKKAVGARFPSLANSLNHSKLKKRVTMMYKTKSSVARRLRAMAIIPAGALALLVTNLPAVASVLSDASAAELTVPGNKVTENTPQRQTVQSMSVQLKGDIAEVTDGNTGTKIITLGKTGDAASSQAADASTTNLTVYVNGEKQEWKSLDNIEAADIAAIEIKKSNDNPADMYVTLKNQSGKSETFLAYTDTKSMKETAAKQKDVYTATETMPQFPGGEAALMNFIADNIRYPEAAMKAGKEGRVVVRFVVTSTGAVTDAEVIRSQGPDLDAEAVRVVSSMPAFTPGTIDGKAVSCHYTIPISFKLKDNKPAKTNANTK